MSDRSSSPSLLNSKLLLYAGLVLQAVFLIGAIVLFKERTLYADTAHFAAEIAGGPRFYLGHRFIAVFSRLLPYLNAIWGGSIKGGLILYSINLALMFTIPYLVITFILKDRLVAFCLLLLQFVFTYRTYYLPISELFHGLMFLMIYWAYIRYLMHRGKPASRSIWTYVLLAIIVNAHPLIILVFAASAVLFSEHRGYWNSGDQKILVPTAFLFFLLSSVIFSTKYEAVILSNSLSTTFSNLDTYQIRVMLSTVLHDYLPTVLMGLLGLGLVFYKYSIRKSFFIIMCLGIVGVLIYLRFAHITFTLTFFEIYLLPIPFILFLALGLNFKTLSGKLQKTLLTLVFALTIFQIIRVLEHGNFYRNRLEIYSSIMDQMQDKGLSKVVLPFYKAPMNEIVDFYTSPFESYLLSQLDNDPDNDGYLITYLMEDSIDVADYKNYSTHMITLGMDSIDVYPFSRYPDLDLSTIPYATFDPDY